MANLKSRLLKLEQRHDIAGLLPVGNIYDGSMTDEEISLFLENFL